MKVIVIGGGHNGLIASIFLRKHGYEVILLEAREKLGGMVETINLGKFKLNRASYVIGLMPDFFLDEFKIPLIKPDPNQVLYIEGKVYPLWRNKEKRINEMKKLGLERFDEFEDKILSFKKILQDKFTFLTKPPSKEMIKEEAEKFGLEDLIKKNCKEFLSEYLPEEFHECFIYPIMENSSAYLVAYFYSLDWSYVKGGMGTLIEILERRALELGVEIFKGYKVEEIIVKENSVKGVKVNNKFIESEVVLSCISPEELLKLAPDLNDYVKFESLPKFRWKKHCIVFKDFPKVKDELKPYLGSIIDSDFAEIVYPSILDESIGAHVIEFMGYSEAVKEIFKGEIAFELTFSAKQAEEEYFLPRGDVNHLPMRDPFLFDNRPAKNWGYKTPIKGLFIGSAGAYPGGQVTGIPGYNAANAIIEFYK